MPTLFKNIKFSIITFISQIISGSIVYIVLARVMSLSDFGILSFGTTFAGLLAITADFGFSLMAQRDIPQDRYDFKEYIFNVFLQKIGFSLISVIGGIVYLFFLYSGLTVTIGLIFLVNAVITSNNMFFFSVFRAKNLFKFESFLAGLYAVVLCVLIFIYLIFNLDVIFLAYGMLFARLMQLVFLIHIFINKFGLPRFHINNVIQIYFFRNSFSFGAHYIIGVFYFSVDSQLLYYYSGNDALAIYQAIFKVVLILLSINDLVSNVFIPFLASRLHSGEEAFKVIATTANKTIITLGLGLFVFINLFARDIVHILYSDKYISALTIVIPLSFVLLFRIMASIYAVLLTISDHQNVRVLTVFASLLINVTLNVLLIPIYGFVGAAYVSMITHLVLVSMYALFSSKHFGSLLLDFDVFMMFIITLLLILLKQYFQLEFNLLSSIVIMFSWSVLLFLIYGKKQIMGVKELFIRKYIE